MLSNINATFKLLFNKTKEYFNSSGKTTTENRYYDKISYIDQYSAMIGEPTYIIDNIYLGSAHNAANYQQLRKLEIKTVINVTKDIYNHYENEFKYYQHPINDDDTSNISKILKETYTNIEENKDGNILIHCLMGASRSCSVILYYLIKKHKMTLEEALKFVKEKRFVINPNLRFINEIKKLV